MASEARKQSMVWMEMDYSKHTHFRGKIKWRLGHLGALGTMGETAPLMFNVMTRYKLSLYYLSSQHWKALGTKDESLGKNAF